MPSLRFLALFRRVPLSLCVASAMAAAAEGTGGDAREAHASDADAALPPRAASRGPTPPQVRGQVLAVTICNDGSPGSLRDVVAHAQSFDTVDLTDLPCGRVSLYLGEITVRASSVTIASAGAPVTIDAHSNSRIFVARSGFLDLEGLALVNGNVRGGNSASGGCVDALGDVRLVEVTMTACTVSALAHAGGGAIATDGRLHMENVTFRNNRAMIRGSGSAGATAKGGALGAGLVDLDGGTFLSNLAIATQGNASGGAIAATQVDLVHSTISGNVALAPQGDAYGGGVFSASGATIEYATLSGNDAIASGSSPWLAHGGAFAGGGAFVVRRSVIDGNGADIGGGLFLLDASTSSLDVRASTLSGNHAALAAGALFAKNPVSISNSTIAFNSASGFGVGGVYAGGATLSLQSSIVANNLPTAGALAADVDGSAQVSGAHNLVRQSGLSLPGDTRTDDPRLLPLAYNGGTTRTHALDAASPAIDSGSNPRNNLYDQRGPGYPRARGAAPDIGAYER